MRDFSPDAQLTVDELSLAQPLPEGHRRVLVIANVAAIALLYHDALHGGAIPARVF